MKRFIIYTSKKPTYTTTLEGDKLKPEHWQYLTIAFWGFILFNCTYTKRFFAVTPCIVHFLGFRFSYDHLNQKEIKSLRKQFNHKPPNPVYG